MGSEGDASQNVGMNLDGIVRAAEDSYNYLKSKRAGELKLEAAVVGVLVWIASLFGLGVWSPMIFGHPFFESAAQVLGSATGLAVAAGVGTFLLLRRRAFKFAQLGEAIAKVKAGPMTAEEGLRLMDAMQGARLAVKKDKVDSAFSNAIAAFIIVGILSLSPGFGLLAGTIVYLYFRYEALREYEKEEEKYQESRKELLQSL